MKKAKKQMIDLTTSSMVGAAGSLGLAGIGGAAATHGQQGIANMFRFAPAMGSMIGTGMLLRQVKKLEPKKKRRRKPK